MELEIINPVLWDKAVNNNRDPYGKAIIDYARRWGILMQEALLRGAKLEDVIDGLSHAADTDNISGFMYGAAVATLAKTWKHGERLAKWYDNQGSGE